MNQGSYDLRRDVDRLKNKTDELAKDYYIEVNSTIVTYKDEVYTPSTIVATAYQSSREITDFYDDGILDLWVSTNGGKSYTYVKQTTSHTISAVINDTTITNYRINLYDKELNWLDRQTITIVRTTKGSAGQGYDFIYYTTEKESLSQSDYPSGDITKLVGNFNEWLQSPKAIDTLHPNVFMSYRTSDDEEHWGNWSTPVKYNARGERGEDGEGLEMIFCRTQYADGYTLDPSTLNPVTTDDYVPSGWTDDQKGVSSTYCFEYVSMRTKEVPTGSKVAQWGKFSPPKLWATFSEDGKDGKGIELIFARNNNPSTAPTFLNNQDKKTYTGTVNNKHFYDDDFVPQNWTDDQTGVDENNQCEWVAKRIKKVTNGVASWESFNTPQLWATFSEDGVDGKDAITVMLGNEAQLIAVDGNGSLKSNPRVITIPVYCYKGTTRVAGTISLSGISNTFSTKTITRQPSASNDGLITLQCTSVPSQITKDEPITITVDGKTYTKYFTWSKIGDGKDGNDGGTFDFVYYTKNDATAPTISSSTTINANTGRNVVGAWCARPTNVSSSNQYCFGAYRKLDYTGSPTGNYSDVYLWAKYGSNGASGTSHEYAYYTTSSATAPTKPDGNVTATTGTEKWTTVPVSMTSEKKYMYVSYRINGGTWSTTALWSKFGDTGASGTSHEYAYYTTSSATAPTKPDGNVTATSGLNKWTTVPVAMDTTNKYMYLSYRINGGTWSTTALWSKFGENGQSITDVQNYYGSATAYDNGTSSDHNDIWSNNISSLSRTNEYSRLKETTTSTIVIGVDIPSTNTIIEFDVYQEDGTKTNFFYQFAQDTNYLTGGCYNHLGKEIGGWTHVKLEIPSSSGYHLLSDGVKTPVQRNMAWNTSTNLIFRFWTSGDISGLRFKNFRVYSGGWHTQITEVPFNSTNKYLWSKEVTKAGDNVVGETTPIMIAEYGKGGQSISSITEEYAISTDTSSSSIVGSWSPTPPTMTAENKYLWNRETINYSNPSSSQTSTPKIIGAYGDKGLDGARGKDGLGLEHIFYLADHEIDWSTIQGQSNPEKWSTTGDFQDNDYVKPNSGWEDNATGVDETNQYEYCSIRTKVYSNDGKTAIWGAFERPTLWAKFGEKGEAGEDGADGLGLEHIFYLADHEIDWSTVQGQSNPEKWSTTGSFQDDDYHGQDKPGNNLWTDNPTGVDETNQYEYCSIRTKVYDNDGKTAIWGAFGTPFLWAKFGADGEAGADGEGMEMIFCRTTTLNGYSSNPSILDPVQTPDYVPSGWTDDPTGVDEVNKYEYVCMRHKVPDPSDTTGKKLIWDRFKSPSLWDNWGERGQDGITPTTDGVAAAVIKEIDPENFDAKSLGGITADGYIEKEPDFQLLTQTNNAYGRIECRKLGFIVIINVIHWIVKKCTTEGWQWLRRDANDTATTHTYTQDIYVPQRYRPANDLIVGGACTGGNLNDMALRLDTDGRLRIKTNVMHDTENIYGTFVFFVDSRTATQLTDNTASTLYYGDYLEAILTNYSSGTVLADKTVTFTINGKNYPRTTDSNGIAKLQLNLNPGSYNYEVLFSGDNSYKPATKISVANKTLTKVPASQVYINSTTPSTVYRTTPFTGYLKNRNPNGNPLSGVEVTVTIGNRTFTGKTNNEGYYKIYHPNDNILYNNSPHNIVISVSNNAKCGAKSITINNPSPTFAP